MRFYDVSEKARKDVIPSMRNTDEERHLQKIRWHFRAEASEPRFVIDAILIVAALLQDLLIPLLVRAVA